MPIRRRPAGSPGGHGGEFAPGGSGSAGGAHADSMAANFGRIAPNKQRLFLDDSANTFVLSHFRTGGKFEGAKGKKILSAFGDIHDVHSIARQAIKDAGEGAKHPDLFGTLKGPKAAYAKEIYLAAHSFAHEKGSFKSRVARHTAPVGSPRANPKADRAYNELAAIEDAKRTLGRHRKRAEDSMEEFEIGLQFEIMKTDDEKRMVYGFASVSSVNGAELVDLQGDVIDMAELTKAAHEFMSNARVGGDMHTTMGTGEIVESMVIDGSLKKVLGITRPEEGWFIGYKVTDDGVWKNVKEGKYAGFSIGGTGVRVPVEAP